jgi:hypothetical protein
MDHPQTYATVRAIHDLVDPTAFDHYASGAGVFKKELGELPPPGQSQGDDLLNVL